MNWFTGLVLFAVIWFMCLFVVLPLRLRTQGDDGDVVPGTPASAPSDPQLWRRVRLVTIIAVLIWVPIAAVILSGVLSVQDLDFFGRMNPAQG